MRKTKKFDYSKIYYLVVDYTEPEQPIWFSDYNELPRLMYRGKWISKIKIRKGAAITFDPIGDNRWQTAESNIKTIITYHIVNDFGKWFNPDKYNWEWSCALARYCAPNFDEWFDKERYNWEHSYELTQFCANHFDKWFDKDKFDWRDSCGLARYCAPNFDKWFDKNKFDWYSGSYALVQYCTQYFDKWFDEKRFDSYDASVWLDHNHVLSNLLKCESYKINNTWSLVIANKSTVHWVIRDTIEALNKVQKTNNQYMVD